MNTNIIKNILIGLITFVLLLPQGNAQLDTVNAKRIDALTAKVNTNLLQDNYMLDRDSYDLVLINNEGGDMTQQTMDQVVAKMGENEHYLYFNATRQKWKGRILAGYSNTREKIETNLTDALNK